MKELDILLLRYLHGAWQQTDEVQKQCFEQFLELPDPQILAYLVAGESAADTPYSQLVTALREARA
jgi:succinate dehydrogenase flavin-adding protein (antitoxin of CptAB toxin-antitoxin module)